jgi:transcription initiation factor IIE alpha subunit
VSVAANLKEAKRHGITKFAGEPCSKCGSQVRYTTSKACVECVKRKHQERKGK